MAGAHAGRGLPRSDGATPANGLGALAADGAYEIVLRDGTTTPAPWSNVIANERGRVRRE